MFGRNIGNVTNEEQEKLRSSVVAVAGTGGVGGAALFNLARIGIENFKVADPETFAYSDTNRQQGSGYGSVDKKKVDMIALGLKAINPSIKIDQFANGLTEENIENFLCNTSIVIDGLDFFCLKIRKRLFDLCRKKGLYILSCPIFGFGTSLAVFSPEGPSFDKFFGPLPEKIDPAYAAQFGRALFPAFPRYINLPAYIEAMRKGRPIPSFATSCALSGAVTAAEAVFILLNKRRPVCAPFVRNYDLFDAKISIKRGGHRKLNFFEKWVLKNVILKKGSSSQYKDLMDAA